MVEHQAHGAVVLCWCIVMVKHQDWRKCQQALKTFQSCLAKAKAAR
jgi:hypothetical protein